MLDRRTLALGLLALGLVLLVFGGFVQLKDFAGSSSEWNLPFAGMALVAAIAAVVVAWPDPRARLWLGIAFVVLAGLLLWQDATNGGFRFIWHESQHELQRLEVMLVLVAAVLMATAKAAEGGGAWMVRVALYLCGAALVGFLAYSAGIAYYDATRCAGSADSNDCLAGLGGLTWSVVAVVICGTAAVIAEILLRRHRKG